jgi:hypothetical protein
VDDLICFAPGITTTWNDVDITTYTNPGGTINARPGITNNDTLEIHRTVIDARTTIHNILGQQAMKEDKVQTYLSGGVVISWDFDLRYSHLKYVRKEKPCLRWYTLFLWLSLHTCAQ